MCALRSLLHPEPNERGQARLPNPETFNLALQSSRRAIAIRVHDQLFWLKDFPGRSKTQVIQLRVRKAGLPPLFLMPLAGFQSQALPHDVFGMENRQLRQSNPSASVSTLLSQSFRLPSPLTLIRTRVSADSHTRGSARLRRDSLECATKDGCDRRILDLFLLQ